MSFHGISDQGDDGTQGVLDHGKSADPGDVPWHHHDFTVQRFSRTGRLIDIADGGVCSPVPGCPGRFGRDVHDTADGVAGDFHNGIRNRFVSSVCG
jgi:hypothetical protein